MINYNFKKTKEEADIIWQIASPLIGRYENAGESLSFIWVGIYFNVTSDEWRTVNEENVNDVVLANWDQTRSPISSNNEPLGKLLMGRYQVSRLEI